MSAAIELATSDLKPVAVLVGESGTLEDDPVVREILEALAVMPAAERQLMLRTARTLLVGRH